MLTSIDDRTREIMTLFNDGSPNSKIILKLDQLIPQLISVWNSKNMEPWKFICISKNFNNNIQRLFFYYKISIWLSLPAHLN